MPIDYANEHWGSSITLACAQGMHYWRDGHDMCHCGANHRRKFALMQRTAKYMRRKPGPNLWNDHKLYKNEPAVFKKAPKRRDV